VNKVVLAHISLFTLNLLYTISYFVVKGVSPKYLDASGFVFVRAAGATILFWLVSLFLTKEKVEKQDLKKLLFACLFGVVFNQLAFFNGLVYTTSINTSIIMTSAPLMALPMSYWMLKEKISSSKILGVVVGFIGALLIILQKEKLYNATNPLLGNILIFTNAAVFTFFLVYVKPMMVKYSPFTVLKWSFLFGTIVLIPVGAPELAKIGMDYTTFPLEIWWSIGYVVIGITFFTFLLNMFALKQVSPSIVSAYIFTQPLLTAILSWIIEGKIMNLTSAFACVLIFVGVYFVSFKKS
jgi:drug/metabolite transporter (DMT)-like permease